MAKRRFREKSEEKAPESLTPEERRIARRRERAQAQSGRFRRGFGSPLRRGLLIGIPIAVITVIVVLLLFNPFNIPSPCLSLNPPSSPPGYPPAGTTDFTGSWCPPGNPGIVLAVEPLLKIVINGTTVALPPGIGINTSFGKYTCSLPIQTPRTPGVLPAGVFVIASPWYFSYNLSWFFQAWAATFPTAHVDSTHGTQPVEYTPNRLLGYSADASHKITLFVDGQPSSAGPSLVLPTLAYTSSPEPIPHCIPRVYGTGHSIVLSYGASSGATGATQSISLASPATTPLHPGQTVAHPTSVAPTAAVPGTVLGTHALVSATALGFAVLPGVGRP